MATREFARNPADVRAGIDASQTSYDSSGREVIKEKTAGDIVREARAKAKETGQSEMETIRRLSEQEVARQEAQKTRIVRQTGSYSQPTYSQQQQQQQTTQTLQATRTQTLAQKYPQLAQRYPELSQYSADKYYLSDVLATIPKYQQDSNRFSFPEQTYNQDLIDQNYQERQITANEPITKKESKRVLKGSALMAGGVVATAGAMAILNPAVLPVTTRAGNYVFRTTGSKTIANVTKGITGTALKAPAIIGIQKATIQTVKSTRPEEQKEVVKRLGKENINTLFQEGMKNEFGSLYQKKGYEKAVKTYYQNEGVNNQELLQSKTSWAVANPEAFYQSLGYDVETSKQKAQQVSGYTNIPGYKRLLYDWVPAGRLLIGGRKSETAFLEGIKTGSQKYDLTEKETQALLDYSKTMRTTGELSSVQSALLFNAVSENIGRYTNIKLFKNFKTPSKATAKEALRIIGATAPAGAFEGAGIQYSIQKGRFQETNVKDIAIGAGLGAGTASGAETLRRLLKYNYPKTSKVIGYGLYISDPLEKPGDILESQAVKVTSRITGKPYKQLYQTQTGKITTYSAQDVFKGKIVTNINNDINKNIKNVMGGKTGQEAKQKKTVKKPTSISINIFNENTVKKNLQNVNSKIGTESIIQDIDNVININTDSISDQIESNVGTQTGTTTKTSIPVNTLIPRVVLPPPIPLGFPLGSGAGRGKGSNRKKFVNELQAGNKLLKGLSFKPQPIFKTKSTPKKKKSTPKKKKGNNKGRKGKKSKRYKSMFDLAFNFPF